MPNVFQGERRAAPGERFAIVVSRYNESVTGKLLAGALEALAAGGVRDGDIDVAWTPGAWELPVAAARFAEAGRHAGILCLGAVIRGETTHDQHINRAVSLQLARLAVRHRVPVLFGLLTCDTLEQALQRAGGSLGNKGSECAAAALEMARLLRQLTPSGPPPQAARDETSQAAGG